MAFPKSTDDLNVIQALSDYPNDGDGLSAAQLKAKFDEAVNTLQSYVNDTLIPYLESSAAAGDIGVAPAQLAGATNVQEALEALSEAIAEATVGTIPDNSLEGVKLKDLAVATAKIAELAVTTAKLAAGAVTTAKLADGAVTNAKTDFSSGLSPTGPLVLKSGVHYFASQSALPAAGTPGRVAFVKV